MYTTVMQSIENAHVLCPAETLIQFRTETMDPVKASTSGIVYNIFNLASQGCT